MYGRKEWRHCPVIARSMDLFTWNDVRGDEEGDPGHDDEEPRRQVVRDDVRHHVTTEILKIYNEQNVLIHSVLMWEMYTLIRSLKDIDVALSKRSCSRTAVQRVLESQMCLSKAFNSSMNSSVCDIRPRNLWKMLAKLMLSSQIHQALFQLKP